MRRSAWYSCLPSAHGELSGSVVSWLTSASAAYQNQVNQPRRVCSLGSDACCAWNSRCGQPCHLFRCGDPTSWPSLSLSFQAPPHARVHPNKNNQDISLAWPGDLVTCTPMSLTRINTRARDRNYICHTLLPRKEAPASGFCDRFPCPSTRTRPCTRQRGTSAVLRRLRLFRAMLNFGSSAACRYKS